jgi:hypothetical protein
MGVLLSTILLTAVPGAAGDEGFKEWEVLASTDRFVLRSLDARRFNRGMVVRSAEELAWATLRKGPDAVKQMERALEERIDFKKHMLILLHVDSSLKGPRLQLDPIEVKGKTLVVRWRVVSRKKERERGTIHHFRQALLVSRFDGEVVFEPRVQDLAVEAARRKKK